ncbi:hypothetical protein LG204_10295 [Methylovorus menthalis]|uniref:hypothetical protein n=1 Tax=Methylovorus menthalis TaxID=1002227 RepID=UPI001E38EAFB|nr:hypothetical protein [Methylovorus menthalis]MCB4811704.1 hypothetical protein [Methylovorus menthalis]
MENIANDFTTTLSSGLTAGATTLSVVSSTGSPDVNFRIRIDDELMLVTNKGAGAQLNWTVERNIEGTIPAEHIAGAKVSQLLTVGGFKQILQEQQLNDVDLLDGTSPIPGTASPKQMKDSAQKWGGGATVCNTIAASGASQALAFATSGDKAYDVTLNSNCNFTFTGGVVGQLQTITLILRQNGSGGFIPTFPAGVKWPGGVAPIPNTSAGRIDVISIQSPDAGVTLLGSY